MASEIIACGVARNSACQRFSTRRRSRKPRAYSPARPSKPASRSGPAQVPSTGAPASTSRAGGGGRGRGRAAGCWLASAIPGMFPIGRRSATGHCRHLSSCLRSAFAAMLTGDAHPGEQRRRGGSRRPARAGGGAPAAGRGDGGGARSRAERVEPQHLAPPAAARRFAVDGTPTDAVYVGVNHVLRDRRPEVVASGINRGANLAMDVLYSGTVAAAMEGTVMGLPSFAISLVGRGEPDFGPAAAFARKLAAEVGRRGLPPGTLLNVNVPPGEPRGARITRIGKRSYSAAVVQKLDPRGRAYYWIGGDEQAHENVPGSDCDAVFDRGLISVTPLHLDLTLHALLEELKEWDLPGLSS